MSTAQGTRASLVAKATVALDNKLTRVYWAVLTRGEEFRPDAAAA